MMLMAAACSSEEELTETSPHDGSEVVITVAMPDQKDTRVNLSGQKLCWNAGDQLYAIPVNIDGRVEGTACVLDIVNPDASSNTAKFKGKLTSASMYRLVYKTDKVKIDGQGNVSIDHAGVTQTKLDSDEHLKNYFLITSDDVLEENISKNVQLYFRDALLRVNLRSLPENLTSITDVKWILNYGGADETVAAAMKFDGTLPVMYETEADRYITMPVDVTRNLVQHAGKKMALQFNGSRTRTVTVTVPAEKTYTANRRYNINVSLLAHEGQKAMTGWDVENDYPLDNQIWAEVGEGGSFCVNGSEIKSESLRGYHVYTDNSVGEILTLGSEFMRGSSNITELVFPRKIEELSGNAFLYSGLSCPLDLRQCKNLQTIGPNSFDGMEVEVLLPSDGAPLSFMERAFDSYLGTSITVPQTTVSLGEYFIDFNPNLNKLVFLPSYKNLYMHENALGRYSSRSVDVLISKEWITPQRTDKLDFNIRDLTPTTNKSDGFWWMGIQWKSISFVEVNADGTPGSEVQGWAEGDDIYDDFDNENPQNGGSLTSTGMEK